MHSIAIVTAYIVCTTPILPTKTKTAAYQQWKLMASSNSKGHPRQKSIKDLLEYISKLRQQGNSVILMCDANASQHKKNGVIQKLCDTCGLQVVNHSYDSNIPTHIYGKDQIDFFMCSQDLTQYVSSLTIQEFGTICDSDHRSLMLDISLKFFLSGSLQRSISSNERIITTKKPKHIATYKKHIVTELQAHHVHTLINTLNKKLESDTLTHNDYNILCQLDEEFYNIRINAEQSIIKCPNKHTEPWSPVLAQAYLVEQFWSELKRSQKTKCNNKKRVEILKARIQTEVIESDDITVINEKLAIAKDDLRRIRAMSIEHRKEYLWQQARAAENDGNLPASKAIKQINRIETIIRRFRRLRLFFGKKSTSQTGNVLIKSGDGTWQQLKKT